jgi:hypothetical protein
MCIPVPERSLSQEYGCLQEIHNSGLFTTEIICSVHDLVFLNQATNFMLLELLYLTGRRLNSLH